MTLTKRHDVNGRCGCKQTNLPNNKIMHVIIYIPTCAKLTNFAKAIHTKINIHKYTEAKRIYILFVYISCSYITNFENVITLFDAPTVIYITYVTQRDLNRGELSCILSLCCAAELICMHLPYKQHICSSVPLYNPI